MVLLALPPADHLLIERDPRPIRAFSATPHDGQRPCRTLAEDPGRTQPRAAYPRRCSSNAVVSMVGIRLGSWESAPAFKGIICHDISEFESSLPSQPVRSLRLTCKCRCGSACRPSFRSRSVPRTMEG